MDTSENKKRVINLLWRNYETQVGSTRKYADRVTIVLGATVGAIGLAVKFSDADLLSSDRAVAAFCISVVSVIGAFVCAGVSWYPKYSEHPSGTDVDRLWQYLVAVEDDESAATLMSDLCKATIAERKATLRIAFWFTACMVFCGVSLVAVMLSEILSTTVPK